jgi:hypothetical protein
VERNHDAVAATLQETLLVHPAPLGVHLAGRLGSYWFIQGRVAEGERWLQAALTQPAALAADVATVELTLAFIRAMRGRTDSAPRLVEKALAHAESIDRRVLAHLLVSLSWSLWLGEDPSHDYLDAHVRALSGGDPVIEVWAELVAAKSSLAVDGAEITAARAAEIIAHGEQVGNIHAAWLGARLAARSALEAGNGEIGLQKLHQVAELHRRLGGTLTADLVEFEAALAAMVGDYQRAARLFGHANTLAFRAGTSWPLTAFAELLLARTREELSTDRFEAAWRVGTAGLESSLAAGL